MAIDVTVSRYLTLAYFWNFPLARKVKVFCDSKNMKSRQGDPGLDAFQEIDGTDGTVERRRVRNQEASPRITEIPSGSRK